MSFLKNGLMDQLLVHIDLLTLIALFLMGVGAFILSTIAGGGGSLVLVPAVNILLGVSKTAPILNLGAFIGRPSRLIIFWKHIKWKVCLFYAPAAIVGAWLGAYLFAEIDWSWLQILVGLFLISTVFQYRFGKKQRSFPMQLWYFIPLGVFVSVMGTITGALGPILNPFYLNLGLDKEDLIATKTANSFLMGLSQLGSYTFFGLLTTELWIYGISLGLGATLGNIIGKRFLSKMSSKTFRQWLLGLMVVSGILLIYGQVSEMI